MIPYVAVALENTQNSLGVSDQGFGDCRATVEIRFQNDYRNIRRANRE